MVMTRDYALERPVDDVVPNLAQFLGAYFHEDWPEEHATPSDVVAAAIDDWGAAGTLELVRRELKWLLEQPLYEAAFDGFFFKELHVSYWTYADGLSPRVWLHQVLDKVAQATWK
jgi:hypothetical protein